MAGLYGGRSLWILHHFPRLVAQPSYNGAMRPSCTTLIYLGLRKLSQRNIFLRKQPHIMCESLSRRYQQALLAGAPSSKINRNNGIFHSFSFNFIRVERSFIYNVKFVKYSYLTLDFSPRCMLYYHSRSITLKNVGCSTTTHTHTYIYKLIQKLQNL